MYLLWVLRYLKYLPLVALLKAAEAAAPADGGGESAAGGGGGESAEAVKERGNRLYKAGTSSSRTHF